MGIAAGVSFSFKDNNGASIHLHEHTASTYVHAIPTLMLTNDAARPAFMNLAVASVISAATWM